MINQAIHFTSRTVTSLDKHKTRTAEPKKNLTYRSNTRRIRLNPRDARLLRLANDFRRNRLMQIQRHEVLDI